MRSPSSAAQPSRRRRALKLCAPRITPGIAVSEGVELSGERFPEVLRATFCRTRDLPSFDVLISPTIHLMRSARMLSRNFCGALIVSHEAAPSDPRRR